MKIETETLIIGDLYNGGYREYCVWTEEGCFSFKTKKEAQQYIDKKEYKNKLETLLNE